MLDSVSIKSIVVALLVMLKATFCTNVRQTNLELADLTIPTVFASQNLVSLQTEANASSSDTAYPRSTSSRNQSPCYRTDRLSPSFHPYSLPQLCHDPNSIPGVLSSEGYFRDGRGASPTHLFLYLRFKCMWKHYNNHLLDNTIIKQPGKHVICYYITPVYLQALLYGLISFHFTSLKRHRQGNPQLFWRGCNSKRRLSYLVTTGA